MKALIAIVNLIWTVVTVAQVPEFKITAPTSGTLTNGTTIVIQWLPPTNVSTVRIILHSDEHHGAYIAQSAPNTGEYVWKVSSETFDKKYYNRFFISIDGCTDYHWCGTTKGDYFTLIDKEPISPKISGIRKFEDGPNKGYIVDGKGEAGFTHFLEYSIDLVKWVRFVDAPESTENGIVSWFVQSPESLLLFRIVTD